MNVARPIAPVTPEEFEAMDKDERLIYELIDGVVMMSPSPSRNHQFAAHRIHGHLFQLLKNSPCRAAGELDIKHKRNIYRPDLMIFCDKDAELPEIIFEILSPSTKRHDLITKAVKYEEMGVKEYWIIDLDIKAITLHDFANQTTATYTLGDTIQSKARPEIIITVDDIMND